MSRAFDLKRFVGAAIVFIASAAILQGVIDRLWPATYWMEMRGLAINDAPRGTAPAVREDRIVHRDISATWQAELEELNPDGKTFTIRCAASGGPRMYRRDNALFRDLSYWFGEVCKDSTGAIIDLHNLPRGLYRVDTCRTLYPARFFSPRGQCVLSNTFKIISSTPQSRNVTNRISKMASPLARKRSQFQHSEPLRLETDLEADSGYLPAPSWLLLAEGAAGNHSRETLMNMAETVIL